MRCRQATPPIQRAERPHPRAYSKPGFYARIDSMRMGTTCNPEVNCSQMGCAMVTFRDVGREWLRVQVVAGGKSVAAMRYSRAATFRAWLFSVDVHHLNVIVRKRGSTMFYRLRDAHHSFAMTAFAAH